MYLSPQILNDFDCSISKYFHGKIFLDWGKVVFYPEV